MTEDTLAAAFISRVGARAEAAAAWPDLEARLGALVAAGRGAWPELGVEPTVFVGWLAERLPQDGELVAALSGLHATDLYLTCALAAGDPQAPALFNKHFVSKVGRHIAHIDRSPSFVDEVSQVLHERLLVAPAGTSRQIAEYAGRGSLEALVRVAAVRIALNLRRGAKPETDPDDEPLKSPSLDPEMAVIKARYQGAFERAYTQALEAIASDDRTVLRLHYLERVSLDELGALYKLHRTSVSRWLAKIKREIVDETNRLLLAELPVTPAELVSLRAIVRSQLEISVARLFQKDS